MLGSVTTSGNTVTLSLTTPSITVTWTNSAQWRASTMSVTYVSSGEIAQMPRNLAFSASTANATVGQDFTEPTLTGNKTDDVTYSSSNTEVATVDAESGNVTLVAAGTTTIKATAPETSEFQGDDVSYTLTVSEAPQSGGDEGNEKVWKLVTDASTLKAGDKITIVSAAKGKIISEISSQYMTQVDVTITDNQFTNLPTNAVELTLGGSVDSWTFTNSDGKLLGATAVKKLAWNNGTTTWKISVSNGDATIQNTTASYGRFLHNVGSTRFTTYASNASSSMLLPQIYRYQ